MDLEFVTSSFAFVCRFRNVVLKIVSFFAPVLEGFSLLIVMMNIR